MKAPDASEDQIQGAIIDWLALLRGVIAFHVPNEGKRSKAAAARQKRLGLVSGAPDIVVLYSAYFQPQTLLIEVKSRSGRQRAGQKDFEKASTAIGHTYIIVRSLDDLIVWWRANV